MSRSIKLQSSPDFLGYSDSKRLFYFCTASNWTTTKLAKIGLVGSCLEVEHFLSGLDLFYTEIFEAYLNF